MDALIINTFLYCSILIIYYSVKRKIDAGFVILSLYAFSSIASILAYTHEWYAISGINNKPITILPLAVLFIVLLVLFIPVLKYDSDKVEFIGLVSEQKLRILIYILLIVSSVSLLINLPDAINGLSGNIADKRDALMENEKNVILPFPFAQMMTMATGMKNISLALFFYTLCFKKYRKYSLLLIVPAILFPVINSLSYSARGGVVFLIIGMVLNFLIVKKFISKKIKQRISFVFILLTSLFLVVFIVITISRFSQKEEGIEFFMYRYAGENFLNFAGTLWTDLKGILYGDTCFPYFRKLLGLDFRSNLALFRDTSTEVTGIPMYIFYTFIGDLICDFGKSSLPFIATIGYFVGNHVFRSKITLELRSLIVINLLLAIYSEGIFIFSFQNYNFAFIFAFLLYFWFKPNRKATLINKLIVYYTRKG